MQAQSNYHNNVIYEYIECAVITSLMRSYIKAIGDPKAAESLFHYAVA
jgi:hypothetical protein